MKGFGEIILEAVQKGGYDHQHNSDAAHLLDPLFWQALGKARGWYEEREEFYSRPKGQSDVEALRHVEDNLGVVMSLPTKEDDEDIKYIPYTRGKKEWKVEQHRLIDHLAEGKDAESFFAQLQDNK